MPEIMTVDDVPYDVKPLQDGLCAVTFILRSDYIQTFAIFLSSMTGLMGRVAWKYKSNPELSAQRIAAQQDAVDASIEQYRECVLAVFNNFLEEGESPREALSLTVSRVSEQYPQSSFDNVKKILTKAKLLKNTGYYKRR